MNKPDWGNAPEWANYVAMDGDGAWYWYEKAPSGIEDCEWKVSDGDFEKVFFPVDIIRNSLKSRPE